MSHYQHALLDERGATNEKLQAANEEILSSNEELVTAKEELQSSNEELRTLNEELQTRNAQLGEANDDIVNLLASVKLPILMLDRKLLLRRYTPAAAEALDLHPSDVGRPFSHLKPNFLVPDIDDRVKDAVQSKTPIEREIQDRRGRWYALHVRPHRTNDDEVDGAVVVLLDIDALKKSADRIEAARVYAHAISDTVSDPLVILHADLRVEHANRSFYQAFRTSRGQTEGKRFYELGAGQWDAPDLRGLLEDVLPQQRHVTGFEVVRDFPSLGPRHFVVSARRLRQEPDQPEKILVVLQDVTEARRLEQERVALLARSQKERETSRFKDEFLAMLSHELRGPMNAMMGWVYLLRTGTLESATTAKAWAAIDRSVQSQKRLIEDLIDISALMAGKLEISISVLDVVALVRSALEDARAAAEAKHISLELSNPHDVVLAAADPDRLLQIVANLLSNAIKFTPGGGRIDVGVTATGDRVEIRVRDTGIGIAPEFLPHVFDRFRQADAGTAKKYSGLGLGLAIVRHLVERHGGEIRAESPGLGHGTTVTVSLPTPADSPSLPVRATSEASAASLSRRLAGLRVLLVDDDADAREALGLLLSLEGATVTPATSASEALPLVAGHDLLISDIAMPGETGEDLIRRIRGLSAEEGGRIPAIALTGLAGSHNREILLGAGFQVYLSKPVAGEHLVKEVLKLRAAP